MEIVNSNMIAFSQTDYEGGGEMVINSKLKVDSVINGGGSSDEWQPPSDWIDISNVGDNEINLLV